MKARTKFQKKIVALSEQLPGLTEDQVTYLQEELFDHKATLSKGGKLSCLDCGHRWPAKDSQLTNLIIGTECPNCERYLRVELTQKRTFDSSTYYQIITTFKGHQVIRLFEGSKYFKAGQESKFRYTRVYENWFSEEGKTENVGYYMTSKWNESWGGEYELRSWRSNTNYNKKIKEKAIYPKKKFIKPLRLRGLKNSTHNLNPYLLFKALFHNPKAETLLKAKQYHMLDQLTYYPRTIDDTWASIKICIRNKYHIAEATEWLDYLKFLKKDNKDVHNAKYVCPDNLMQEHNRYVEKERKARQKEAARKEALKLEKQLRESAEFEKNYAKNKAAFIGLEFSNNLFNIRFLNSVEEIRQEGDILRHCVFARKYFKEPTLLFSVTKEGKKVATAEVSPKTWRVLQVKARFNLISPDTDAITHLITKNFKTIQNCTKPKRKTKRKLEIVS